MNDGMFIALRGEAQEMNSLLRQILDELKRQSAPPPSPELQAEAPLVETKSAPRAATKKVK